MHWEIRKTIDLIDTIDDTSSNDDTENDMESEDTESEDTESEDTDATKDTEAGPSTGNSSFYLDDDNLDKEDEIVRAITNAAKLHRDHPPSVILEDIITDICFHPVADTIGIASITGDIFMYKYNNEETSLVSTIEVHEKACRDIEFSEDGQILFSAGKDLCLALTNVETEKLIRLYERAHEKPIYKMTIINEYMFATGDDDGVVKLWDLRQKGNNPISSINMIEDYITAMITNKDAKYLVCASGDGYLTTINIPERRMLVQSEEYDEELTCLGLFKSESKLLAGGNKGKIYVFNWGEFGLHSDEFPSVTKMAITCMVPITENIAIIGQEDGIIRASNLFPYRNVGKVGQHDSSIEALDISNDGTLIASACLENDVKFWNVQYFETLNVTEFLKGGKKKWLKHNLPSSETSNRSDFFTDL